MVMGSIYFKCKSVSTLTIKYRKRRKNKMYINCAMCGQKRIYAGNIVLQSGKEKEVCKKCLKRRQERVEREIKVLLS